MKIFVSTKQIGKKPKVGLCEIDIPGQQNCLRDIITAFVTAMVESYNTRSEEKSVVTPLSSSDISDMSEIGKITFGINYGKKGADLGKAIEAAIIGFTDGLYRVFLGEREITKLDDTLDIKEGDTFTFIRLVMLSGRLW